MRGVETVSKVTIIAMRGVWVALVVVVHGGTAWHICKTKGKKKTQKKDEFSFPIYENITHAIFGRQPYG